MTDHHLPTWLFPLAFPIVFVGVLWLVGKIVGRLLPRRNATAGPNDSAPKQTAPKQTAAAWVVVFGLIFALAGLTTLVMITIYPVYRSARARHWPTTPGTVTRSRLNETVDSDNGHNYTVDIRYRYGVAGHEYEGARYYGGIGSAGFYGTKLALVQANPPGKAVVVHYDPADPADAMLTTALPPGTLSMVWFPLLFLGVGGGILIRGVRKGRRAGFWTMTPAGAQAARPTSPPAAPASADARGVRRRQFLGITGFMLFWNGVIGVMLFATRGSYFLIPFALFGLLLIVFAAYAWLQMFNPVVGVTFARMPLTPGTRTDVSLNVGGNYTAVRRLEFVLEGREQVTYREGTNTRTETHVAWSLPVYETTSVADFERGRFTIDLPPDAMPTFIAKHNRFTWRLRCRGEIPHRPNIDDTFDVTVSAAPAEESEER